MLVVGWARKGKAWGAINRENLHLQHIRDMAEFVYGWHKHCFTYDSKKSEFMVCIFHGSLASVTFSNVSKVKKISLNSSCQSWLFKFKSRAIKF